MAHDTDKLLASNYDGIQEYDNDLPRWWLALFYATIIFAGAYTAYYELGPGLTPVAILEGELKVAAAAKEQQLARNLPEAPSEEKLLQLTKDAAAVAKGQAVYAGKCLACHGPQGQGLVGPNLTDNFWLHGGKLTDNLKTVEDGVLDKGMLAWKSVLPPDELQAVVAYIYTLRGTNPPNPKPPQGEPLA